MRNSRGSIDNRPPLLHWPGRISDDGHSIGHILGDDCTGANYGTFANAKRTAFIALLEDRVRADISEIVNMDAAIAPNARGEGYEVTDNAVVGDIGVDVEVAEAADLRIAGDHRVFTEYAAFAYFIFFIANMIGPGDGDKTQAGVPAFLDYDGSRLWRSDSNRDEPVAVPHAGEIIE